MCILYMCAGLFSKVLEHLLSCQQITHCLMLTLVHFTLVKPRLKMVCYLTVSLKYLLTVSIFMFYIVGICAFYYNTTLDNFCISKYVCAFLLLIKRDKRGGDTNPATLGLYIM